MRKNIAITGGYGYLGSNLAKLLNTKFNIFFLEKINKKNISLSQKSNIKTFDINEINKIFFKKYKIDTIIHLGWTAKYFNSKNKQQKNFLISKKLLENSLNSNCNFIFSSTSAVYGDSLLKKPILNEYAKSKLKFENHLKKFFLKKNKIYVLRLFNIYGLNESMKKKRASSIYKFIKSLKKEKQITLYNGIKYKGKEISPSREWLHVQDACKIIELLISKKIKNGVYDVSCKEKVSFDDLAKLLIQKFKYGDIKYSRMPKYKKLNYQRFNFSTKKHISNFLKYKFLSLEKGIEIH